MAFFYASTGATKTGTATGDTGRETTARTGGWAAMADGDVFPSIEAVIATVGTALAAGDIIFVPNDNLPAYSGNTTLAFPTSGVPVRIVSTLTTNVAIYKEGADETFSTVTLDLSPTGRSAWYGVSHSPTDDWDPGAGADTMIIMNGGSYNPDESTDFIHLDAPSCNLVLNDFTIAGSPSVEILINTGAYFEMNGGIYTSDGTWSIGLLHASSGSGGFTAKWNYVNLSVVTGTLILDVGSSPTSDDAEHISFNRCKVAAGVVFLEETFTKPSQRMLATNCSDDADAAEWQYELHTMAGVAKTLEAGTNVVTRADDQGAGDGFNGNKVISMQVSTNSTCSIDTPFVFELPAFFELSDASTDSLTIEFACDTALDDRDVYFEIHYPDGTNKQTWNHVSGAPQIASSYTVNPLVTPGALDAGTGDWLESGSPYAGNEYSMTVSTDGDVGYDSVPVVKIFITKPNLAGADPVWFDVVVNVGAG